MSFLREPGDLSRTPLAAILLEAWSIRATGELTVQQPGGDSRLYFRDGMPVGAQTFAGFHPLGQILLGRGLIDIETLGRSLAEMARTKRRQGDVLVEMGVVSQEIVDRALEEQQAGYLSLIAALSEGAFRFDPVAPVPAWAGRVLVAPMRAVIDALATPQGAPLCASALTLAEGPLALAHGYGENAVDFSWTGPRRRSCAAWSPPPPPRRSWPRRASRSSTHGRCWRRSSSSTWSSPRARWSTSPRWGRRERRGRGRRAPLHRSPRRRCSHRWRRLRGPTRPGGAIPRSHESAGSGSWPAPCRTSGPAPSPPGPGRRPRPECPPPRPTAGAQVPQGARAPPRLAGPEAEIRRALRRPSRWPRSPTCSPGSGLPVARAGTR